MANNDRGQGLISKYVWVIETIYRAKKISFRELNEKWLDADISRGVEIPKRTFDNWKYQIWDLFGIDIVNENRGEYRYYLSDTEDISKNGLRSWLYNTFCVSNALANSQSIKDRILLEYVPSGQENLQTIIDAMKENRVLNITHYNYWKDQEYQGQTGHIQSCIQDSQAPTGLILTVPPQLPGLLPFRQVDGLMMHGFVGMGDVLPCHKILSGELLNFFNISVVNLII